MSNSAGPSSVPANVAMDSDAVAGSPDEANSWGRRPWRVLPEDISQTEVYDGRPVEVIEVTGTHEYHGPGVEFVSLLEDHEFGNSWGEPITVDYTPPDEDFSDVILWIKASTHGRQFDRLGHVVVGGAEVWRFSTPEPSGRDIYWHTGKDVTAYLPLFKQPQQIQVRLDNVVDSTYTGPITLSLHATFYRPRRGAASETVRDSYNDVLPPSSVLPFTAPGSDARWSVPAQNVSAAVPALPRNVTRAIVDVFASGNANEEFWYDHQESPYSEKYGQGKYGPIRAIEVLVDGEVAGEALPYTVIYTGGISPYLWNAVVGTRAYDVPSYRVDLTPYLPKLWEGASTIEIRVANGNKGDERYKVENDWIINAALLTWERSGVTGTGSIVSGSGDTDDRIDKNIDDNDSDLYDVTAYTYNVNRRAELQFTTPNGTESFAVEWQQRSAMNNAKHLVKDGNVYTLQQNSTTADGLLVDDAPTTVPSWVADYALTLRETYVPHTNATGRFTVDLTHFYEATALGAEVSVFQNGTSSFIATPKGVTNGTGSLDTFYHEFHHNFDYDRHVVARKAVIVKDKHGSTGQHGS